MKTAAFTALVALASMSSAFASTDCSKQANAILTKIVGDSFYRSHGDVREICDTQLVSVTEKTLTYRIEVCNISANEADPSDYFTVEVNPYCSFKSVRAE